MEGRKKGKRGKELRDRKGINIKMKGINSVNVKEKKNRNKTREELNKRKEDDFIPKSIK